MATTSMWAVKHRLDKVIRYTTNPEKTGLHARHDDLGNVLLYTTREEKVEFVSGVNCMPEDAKRQMEMTKKAWGKTDGRLAYHGYQSFKPGETTPEQAHEIGVELARRMWGDRFQVVVATHTDRDHLHNHFVVNSVSFADGKKFCNYKKDYWGGLRVLSDAVCREYGLSVIENPGRARTKHYKEAMDEKAGKPTLRSLLRADVDEAIEKSLSFKGFVAFMERKGYEVKHGPNVTHIAVRPAGAKDFIRLYHWGNQYEESGIRDQITGIIPKAAPAMPQQPRQPRRRPRPYRPPRQHKKLKGVAALYWKYLYMLGKAGKRKLPTRAAHVIRADLQRLDRYARQFRFLRDNSIATDTDLAAYAENRQREVERMVAERKALYKVRKRATGPRRAAYDAQVEALTLALRMERQQLRVCVQIQEDKERVRQQVQKTEAVLEQRRHDGKEHTRPLRHTM